MARKRPKDNPAVDHIDWMHARPPRPRLPFRARTALLSQTSFCAIADNVQKQPCKMFKPKRSHADYL